MKGLGYYIRLANTSYKKNKKTFIFYVVLRVLIVITLIRCLFTENYESAWICALSEVLFLLPALVQYKMKLEIPGVFQSIIFAFIFAAEILGEVNHYYVRIPGWDTMLHTCRIDQLRINNPQVVTKSYPHYWDDLKDAQFDILNT